MEFTFGISPEIAKLCGFAGVGCYVVAYCLLCSGWFDRNSRGYVIMVVFASSLLLVSLLGEFNIMILLIQGFYLSISVATLLRDAMRADDKDAAALPIGTPRARLAPGWRATSGSMAVVTDRPAIRTSPFPRTPPRAQPWIR